MNTTKPVTLVAGGTHGDVHPYVLLARELRMQGVDAQVAASERWREWIETHQVPYRPIPADPVELLLHPRFRSALTLAYGLGAGIRTSWQYLREMRPYVVRLQREIPRMQRESRAIIAGVASQWIATPHVWQSIPFVWGVFQPVAPTRDFASPLSTLRMLPRFNRLSHQIVNRLMWISWQMHGLGYRGGLTRIDEQPAFFAFSQQLVAPWSDMATQHNITGWMHAESGIQHHTAIVNQFLADATPFVMVTFGTPAANESTALYDVVVQASQTLGVRALIQVPAHLAQMPVPAGVLLVSDHLNHQRVFAQAAAVIHHGGAGTTHACIAAGVPMVIVPRGIDQFFWAKRVVDAALMPMFIDRARISHAMLVTALDTVMHHPEYRARVVAMRQREQHVSGVTNATQFVMRVL